MDIQVLGPGCSKCVALERRLHEALDELGEDATIEKVTDYAAIASHGILATPGLMIDGRVVLSGKVPTVRALKKLLVDHLPSGA